MCVPCWCEGIGYEENRIKLEGFSWTVIELRIISIKYENVRCIITVQEKEHHPFFYNLFFKPKQKIYQVRLGCLRGRFIINSIVCHPEGTVVDDKRKKIIMEILGDGKKEIGRIEKTRS